MPHSRNLAGPGTKDSSAGCIGARQTPKPTSHMRRTKRPEANGQTPGSELRREYRGKTVVAKVLENGFEFEGKTYGSLSAVASAATGTHWNGLVFFGVKKWNQSTQETKRAAS